MNSKYFQIFSEVLSESISTIVILFRILIPALIIVKILEYFGATEVLANITKPLMGPLGLPDIAGLIWATAMLANIYTAIAVFLTFATNLEWTQAQVTCLGILMLTTHNMVVELRIAQQAGCRLLTQLLLRVFCAILFCYVCHLLFSSNGWLQQPASFIWQPKAASISLMGWVIEQTINLGKIAIVIFFLISLLKVFKAIGIERLLTIILQPLFRFIGLAKEATTITIVGFTLGLAYGGGLLIKEAQSEKLDRKDVFTSLSLLGICHSLIEDTLLVMIIGADLATVLLLRLLMSIIIIALLVRLTKNTSASFKTRYLVRNIGRD